MDTGEGRRRKDRLLHPHSQTKLLGDQVQAVEPDAENIALAISITRRSEGRSRRNDMKHYEPYRTPQEKEAYDQSRHIGPISGIPRGSSTPNPPVPDEAGVKQWAYLRALGYGGEKPTRREAARLIHELEATR